MLAQEKLGGVKLSELKQLWLHLTYSCNLSCQHCLFRCSPEKEAVELSLEVAQNYIREGLELGVKEVYVTGGEPLLWSDLTKFLQWYL
jgi:MoaA/NifB/PqqE/SkfB family radical SAM enzyme